MRPVALVALLLWAVRPVSAAEIAAPVVKPELLKSIAPHVSVIPDESRGLVPNIGFIEGNTGVLVIDTGLGPSEGAKVAAVAQKMAGQKKLYLITTHVHPEHDLGAQSFPASTILIRSKDQEQEIDDLGLDLAKVFASRSPAIAAMLKDAQFRKANVTFETIYTLDLGGVRVSFMAEGPDHTRGDTVIWDETDRVLFAGDLAMKGQPALIAPFSLMGHWQETLGRLAILKAAIVVPSHGPIGDAGYITGYQKYFAEVRERTLAEKKAGKSEDEAVAGVAAAMSERFPDRGRLEGAVRAAYAEG